MKVYIPFLERFREPMLNDVKIWTSRTRKYGEVGDVFEKFGATFEILAVEKNTLTNILFHWKEEGCNSYEDALATWRQLHPKRELDFDEWFWTHIFRRRKE